MGENPMALFLQGMALFPSRVFRVKNEQETIEKDEFAQSISLCIMKCKSSDLIFEGAPVVICRKQV